MSSIAKPTPPKQARGTKLTLTGPMHANTLRTYHRGRLQQHHERLSEERQAIRLHGIDLIGEKLTQRVMTGQGIDELPTRDIEHEQQILAWIDAFRENDAAIGRIQKQLRGRNEDR